MTLTEAQGRIAFLEGELHSIADLLGDMEERHRTLRDHLQMAASSFESNPRFSPRLGAIMVRDQLRRTKDCCSLLRSARGRAEAAL
jgi:hypothetical protein